MAAKVRHARSSLSHDELDHRRRSKQSAVQSTAQTDHARLRVLCMRSPGHKGMVRHNRAHCMSKILIWLHARQ